MFYLQKDKNRAYRGGGKQEMGGMVEGKNKGESKEKRKSPPTLQIPLY